MLTWLEIAVIAWLFRYFRLIVNCISHWTFRPIPIPEHPTYTSQDVTIILPTISIGGQELLDTIRTCLSSQPHELILVTVDSNVDNLKRSKNMSIWSFLGAAYLERRNFDCSACLHIDGGLPCLSGRTVAYRSSILQDEAFQYGFTNEQWMTCQLNADDDNFITRWMYSHKWKIAMQYHREAEVQTVLEDSPKYLWQCLRWVRSNWRSNLTSMFVERHYWWTQPWSTYSVLQTTITAWALPYDLFIFYSWNCAAATWSKDTRSAFFIALALWTFAFSKTVKLWGHFFRYPSDVMFLPVYIFFGYFHGLIKLYGLLTLHATTWGSREGADADNRVRMIRLPRYGSLEPDGRKSDTFDSSDHDIVLQQDYLPAYETHPRLTTSPLTATYHE